MKIEESSQKLAIMHQLTGKGDKPELSGAQADSVAKPQTAADTVQLSGGTPITAELQTQQAQRAQRVAEIKAQVEAGKYQVSARAVAEKMLSKVGGGTLH